MIPTIKRFLFPLQKSKKLTAMAFFHMTFWSLGGILLLYFNKQIALATELGDADMIIQYLLYFGVLTIASYLSILFFESAYDYLIWEMKKNLNAEYLKKVIYLDNSSFETIGTGYMNSLLLKGIDRRGSLVQSLIYSGFPAVIEVSFAFLLVFDSGGWKGVFLFFIAIVFSLLCMNRGTNISLSRRRKKKSVYSLIDKHIIKILMSKFEILLSNKTKGEIEKLNKKRETIAELHKGDRHGILTAYTLPKFFNEIVRGSIYFFVGLGVIEGTYSIADYVLLITVIELFRGSINGFVSTYREFAKTFMYVQRLRHTFDTIPEISGIEKGKKFVYNKGDIHIKNIKYAYKKIDTRKHIEKNTKTLTKKISHQVFDGFSLHIKGGKKIALVGVSGSGKTTLVKLIAGYLRPDSGSIDVDNQEIGSVSLSSYYNHIGYLTQEPNVFDGTVIENLTYGIKENNDTYKPERLKEKLDQAIRLSKSEFIYNFPDGVDTNIGERGVRLSGGQRQRLAIAKIFLKNPEIIILDEPTAALDSFSEEAITEAMNNLFTGRTVIIIAHRLQTVKQADEIIVMEQGKIVERGTHQQLIEKGTIYAKMLELQSGF